MRNVSQLKWNRSPDNYTSLLKTAAVSWLSFCRNFGEAAARRESAACSSPGEQGAGTVGGPGRPVTVGGDRSLTPERGGCPICPQLPPSESSLPARPAPRPILSLAARVCRWLRIGRTATLFIVRLETALCCADESAGICRASVFAALLPGPSVSPRIQRRQKLIPR